MGQYSQNFVFQGLGTLSTTLPFDGPFSTKGKISLPTLPKGDATASACLVTINKNGSPIYTGAAGAEGFYVTFSGVLGDVIAYVFSSAAAVDQPMNVIKSTLGIWSGTGE